MTELSALGVELVLYSDQPLHPSHLLRLGRGDCTVRISPPMRYLRWEQHWLADQCLADRVELLHSPFHFGLPCHTHCPRVVTLHDAIDQVYDRRPWSPSLHPRVWSNRLSRWIARTRATHVITVSQHSKRDLMRVFHLPEDRISVIHEAADKRFHPGVPEEDVRAVRQRLGLRNPYFFYVGGWEKRKNLPFLLRGFAAAGRCQADLVLAGGNVRDHLVIAEIAASLRITERVRLLPWVEDGELPALYGGALAFVYPSAYEGFGLQLCEAMACGCPVLSAHATSLPEILGEGGDTFSLQDTSELARQLIAIAFSARYRQQLRERALARSESFRWSATAWQTLCVYRSLCPEH